MSFLNSTINTESTGKKEHFPLSDTTKSSMRWGDERIIRRHVSIASPPRAGGRPAPPTPPSQGGDFQGFTLPSGVPNAKPYATEKPDLADSVLNLEKLTDNFWQRETNTKNTNLNKTRELTTQFIETHSELNPENIFQFMVHLVDSDANTKNNNYYQEKSFSNDAQRHLMSTAVNNLESSNLTHGEKINRLNIIKEKLNNNLDSRYFGGITDRGMFNERISNLIEAHELVDALSKGSVGFIDNSIHQLKEKMNSLQGDKIENVKAVYDKGIKDLHDKKISTLKANIKAAMAKEKPNRALMIDKNKESPSHIDSSKIAFERQVSDAGSMPFELNKKNTMDIIKPPAGIDQETTALAESLIPSDESVARALPKAFTNALENRFNIKHQPALVTTTVHGTTLSSPEATSKPHQPNAVDTEKSSPHPTPIAQQIAKLPENLDLSVKNNTSPLHDEPSSISLESSNSTLSDSLLSTESSGISEAIEEIIIIEALSDKFSRVGQLNDVLSKKLLEVNKNDTVLAEKIADFALANRNKNSCFSQYLLYLAKLASYRPENLPYVNKLIEINKTNPELSNNLSQLLNKNPSLFKAFANLVIVDQKSSDTVKKCIDDINSLEIPLGIDKLETYLNTDPKLNSDPLLKKSVKEKIDQLVKILTLNDLENHFKINVGEKKSSELMALFRKEMIPDGNLEKIDKEKLKSLVNAIKTNKITPEITEISGKDNQEFSKRISTLTHAQALAEKAHNTPSYSIKLITANIVSLTALIASITGLVLTAESTSEEQKASEPEVDPTSISEIKDKEEEIEEKNKIIKELKASLEGETNEKHKERIAIREEITKQISQKEMSVDDSKFKLQKYVTGTDFTLKEDETIVLEAEKLKEFELRGKKGTTAEEFNPETKEYDRVLTRNNQAIVKEAGVQAIIEAKELKEQFDKLKNDVTELEDQLKNQLKIEHEISKRKLELLSLENDIKTLSLDKNIIASSMIKEIKESHDEGGNKNKLHALFGSLTALSSVGLLGSGFLSARTLHRKQVNNQAYQKVIVGRELDGFDRAKVLFGKNIKP